MLHLLTALCFIPLQVDAQEGGAPVFPTARKSAPAAHVVTASGANPSALDITSYAIGAGSPGTVLSGVEFLSFDLAGRSALYRLDPKRAQRFARPGIPTFVELPNGTRIYHYRRASASIYGYLAIDMAGTVHVLMEAPDYAPADPDQDLKDHDPFVPFIAASSDSTWIAAATVEEAAGDLYLLPAAGGAPRLLSPSGPLKVDGTSLTFTSTALFATQESKALLRAPLAGGPVSSLQLPKSGNKTPNYVSPEFAVSEDGSTIAFIAGDTPIVGDVYVATTAGVITNLTKSPDRYRPATLGPSGANGPLLALSADGSQIAYLRAMYSANWPAGYTGQEDDLYLCQTATPTQLALVTDDAHFDSWIGTGITVGFQLGQLVFGMAGQTGKFDFYSAKTPPGGPYSAQVVNLTLTGSALPPFQDYAQIAPSDFVMLPGSTARVIVDVGSQPGLRFAAPFYTSPAVTAPAPNLLGPALSDGSVAFAFTELDGTVGVATVEATGARPTTAGTLGFPAGTTVTAIAASHALPYLAAVASAPGAPPAVVTTNVAVGTTFYATLAAGSSVQTLDVDNAGRSVVAITTPAGTSARILATSGAPLFSTPAAPALFVLR